MGPRLSPLQALAACPQLYSGPLGPRACAEAFECLECGMKLVARKASLTPAAKPFPVGQLCPCPLQPVGVGLVEFERCLERLVGVGIVRKESFAARSN